MQLTNTKLTRKKGFTMVELIVVIVIIGLTFPLMTFILKGYHDAYYLDEKARISNQGSRALWYMEDSVRLANSFLTSVSSEYQEPYGPHNLGTSGGEAWSYKGDSTTNRVLIARNYATTVNGLGTGREPVFKDTAAFNCTTQMSYQPQLTYVSIYFVRNGTLYYRIVPDKVSALCPGNSAQQLLTCPPYITSGRNASCEANDEVLATNVTNFTVGYYQLMSDGSSVQLDPTYTSIDPAVLSTADYAIVTLTQSVRGGAVTSTLSQRITKVNQ